LIPTYAKFGSFFTYLYFRIRLDYQLAIKIASPTTTTPRSTRCFEPATTSTPALGGAETRFLSEDPGFKEVWTINIAWKMKKRMNVLKILYVLPVAQCGCKLGPGVSDLK
jgi:hypothetical protein